MSILKRFKQTFMFIYVFFSAMDTWVLFAIPFLLGLFYGVIWSKYAKHMYGYIPREMNNFVAISSLLLLGAGGVVFIIRKEFPVMPFVKIKGIIAVLIGVIWVVFLWGLAFIGIWDFFF